MPLDLVQTQIWGDVFEIAVKRGVLYCLQHEKIVVSQTAGLENWRTLRLHQLITQVQTNLGVKESNPDTQAVVNEYVRHLLVIGYGLGWTVIQQWLATTKAPPFKSPNQPLELAYLWAPFALPARNLGERETKPAREERLTRFGQLLGLTQYPGDKWAAKGKPPQADFLLGVSTPDQQLHLLCLEFSLNALPQLADFRTEQAHLDELKQYANLIQRRGVFSRLNTEVTDPHFRVSDKLVSFIGALITRDKPLYKLFQGCSYLTELVKWLRTQNKITKEVQAQVIAVTAAGLEGINATLNQSSPDAKAQLMQHFAQVYPSVPRTDEINETTRQRQIDSLFRQMAKALPEAWREQLTTLKPGLNSVPQHLVLSEVLSAGQQFINPSQPLPREQLLKSAGNDAAVAELLGQPVPHALSQSLEKIDKTGESITLRDIHAAAIHAGIRAAKPDTVNVLCLEGHPGIGKTTAMLTAIGQMLRGYLFIYVSPRVLINNEVSGKLAEHPDILTLTSNYVLNSGAREWYQEHQAEYPLDLKNIEGAVHCNHPKDFKIPQIGTLFLTTAQADQITGGFGSSGFKSTWRDDHNKVLSQPHHAGVMDTLAKAGKASLKNNPQLNKVVLTASIQSYRDLSSSTTIDKLVRTLFIKAEDLSELEYRLAPRFQNIIVMIDEITGDGAGAHVVHEFAEALEKYFLKPYHRVKRTSPFHIILAIADASLGNEAMLRSYLAEEVALSRQIQSAPEKILVSPGRPGQPFSLSASPIRLGTANKPPYPALHIMADSFPATRLQINYQVSLSSIRLDTKQDGRIQLVREAQCETMGEEWLRLAITTIFKAVRDLPIGEQVILFAQDKVFLRQLEQILTNPNELRQLFIPEIDWQTFQPGEIAKLDSSVNAQTRRTRMAPVNRDRVRVWLMTSSGSRGISFPKVTHIIAFVPRFAIEGGLMEIAQLIYRGRGEGNDHLNRQLTLLLQDFVFHEANELIEPLYWAQRVVDVLTMLVILRSTIMTRIQGHADIQGQNLAIVPVGKIVTAEILQTLSESLRSFLYEANASKLDKELSEKERAIAAKGYELAYKIFPKFQWINQCQNPQSITHIEGLQTFTSDITQLSHVLLEELVPQKLPKHWACTGVLIFEHWAEGDTSEQLVLENWDQIFAEQQQELSRLLGVIDKNAQLPEKIRRMARDLKVAIDEPDLIHEFHIIKKLKSNHIWVTLPLDYLRFTHNNKPMQLNSLAMPEAWLETLKSAATLSATASAHHPVIPKYEKYPFFAMVSRDNPLDLARLFNSKYFSATTEMNLLNTLLFTGQD
ncbi:MAG: hypothetical protein HC877_08055 [Thioploca sp.]|nr:hypothetical protein [Thioploca sp.]